MQNKKRKKKTNLEKSHVEASNCFEPELGKGVNFTSLNTFRKILLRKQEKRKKTVGKIQNITKILTELVFKNQEKYEDD